MGSISISMITGRTIDQTERIENTQAYPSLDKYEKLNGGI